MGLSGGNLWSALGVSFSYLGGTFYANTGQERPWSVELIFGMDF